MLLSSYGEFLGEELLKDLNDKFLCLKIVKGQPTQVYFKEMNSKRLDGSIYYWLQLDNICLSVFFACKRFKVAPLHPQGSPTLAINEDGNSFIVTIRANGTYYRKNQFSNLVMADINGERTLVNSRG